MIISAGRTEQFEFARTVGVGLIEPCINLSKILMFDPPKELVFVGSCGSYGKAKIGDVLESTCASNIENSFFSGAYTPLDNIVCLENSDVSYETIINSSNYITTDKSLWQGYLSHKIQAENMEFFAVLKMAEHFLVKTKGIFVVTNYCDQNAHQDYLKNYAKAKEILSQYLKEKSLI